MLKLGEKIIKSLYLGDKAIAKVFLGAKLLYQKLVNQPIFLDYIIFDGNSWIDIDYKPTNNTRVVGKASFTQWHPIAGANYVFGVFGDSANFGFNAGSNRAILNVPWGSNSGIQINNDTVLGQVYSFDISKNGVYIDDVLKIGTSQLSATFTANKSFFVGWSNGTSTQKLIGTVYPMQIYENDVLVKDLRPCILNDVVGLYDMVTGKFHTNIGTGTIKPNGRFVDSIVFDGNSYIDTGIACQTCTVKTAVKYEANKGRRMLSGFSGTGSYWGMSTGGLLELNGKNVANTNLTDYTDVEFRVDATNNMLYCKADGVEFETNTVSTSDKYTIGCTQPASANKIIGNVYYSTFYDAEGVLIQDLRPYVDSDGVACFKDLVTGDIFYNKGTGTLGYTEIPKPTTEHTEIEYLEGNKTSYINTGVIGRSGLTIELNVYIPSKAQGETHFIGSRTSTNRFYPIYYSTLQICSRVGNMSAISTGQNVDTQGWHHYLIKTSENKDIEYVWNGVNKTGTLCAWEYVDGELEAKIYNEFSGSSDANMYLFGINNDGTPLIGNSYFTDSTGYIRFAFCKIWDSENVLIRDYIPVEKSDGVKCLYDKVEGKYYEFQQA